MPAVRYPTFFTTLSFRCAYSTRYCPNLILDPPHHATFTPRRCSTVAGLISNSLVASGYSASLPGHVALSFAAKFPLSRRG